MKRTVLAPIMFSVLACVPAIANAADPNMSSASSSAARSKMSQMFGEVEAMSKSAAGANLCAVTVIPGPATSFDIRFGVFNIVSANIDYLIIDTFRALNGQSLLFQSVFNIVGIIDNLYPNGTNGKGPAVLGITDLGELSSVSFNVDPDTYDNPDFGATVLDMNNTELEAVYSDGTRCRGVLHFSERKNASVANLTQVYP